MTICRPSMRQLLYGTVLLKSFLTRFSSCAPNSLCTISRPRNLSVILVLSPFQELHQVTQLDL